MPNPAGIKDPALAALLSFCFPGAGYAYVGNVPAFFRTMLIEFAVFCFAGGRGWTAMFAIGLHIYFTIAAAGAARVHNALQAAEMPPPPPVRSGSAPGARWDADVPPPAPAPAWSSDAPPPPPPPVPAPAPDGPPLTADEFLAELRDAWGDHAAGRATDGEFAARKSSAIERVRVRDVDDGVALLEATTALVGAGIMTPAERGRLKLRVSRP